MRLFSVGRRLKLGLQRKKDGGWSLLVSDIMMDYMEREKRDVLKIGTTTARSQA